MKTGIIVLCRFNSSRLPGKILREIDGKPVLSYILERLQLSKHAKGIVVATSDQSSDDPIAKYCEHHSVSCYRGSLDNVSERFLECAQENQFDYATRINGDNLFADASLIDKAVDLAVEGSFDFVSNVDQRTFPTGMSVEVVQTSFYAEKFRLFSKAEFLEHVTLFFYKSPSVGKFHFFYNDDISTAHGLKLAVDCEEDLNFVSLLLQKMKKPHTQYSWEEIVSLATNEK